MNGPRARPSSPSQPSVLVVAGEASGDRIAASIVRSASARKARCFGMGGPALAAAGAEVLVDFRAFAAMGVTEVAGRLPAVAKAFVRLAMAARTHPPAAALLVNYTEFNFALGTLLKRSGVPVLWCVAPQVWAWRPGRALRVARALDRLAVILPFEEPLWRAFGVDAHYIGHPALDAAQPDRALARARLGIASSRPAVALLPGSRPHEVRRHTAPMLEAIEEMRGRGIHLDARLLAAGSLDRPTRAWLAAHAERSSICVVDVDTEAGLSPSIAAFDAAICASGTATLECALAGVPPVIVYRVSRLTSAVARRFVRTPFVALPNILLDRRAFPELLDTDVAPRSIANALGSVLERRAVLAALSEELRNRLTSPRRTGAASMHVSGATSGERAASLLSPWLGDVAPTSSVSIPSRARRRGAAGRASTPP